MPLDNYYTRPDFSRQIKQYSGTTATLSGQTNILEKFSIKSIEVDTDGALAGDALLYDLGNNKFKPAQQGSFSNAIFNGLILSYNSGLTYNVSQGSYRINNQPFTYTGGTVDITSGLTSGSRFDVVYITSANTPTVLTGITAAAPVIPIITSATELQIGIISIPALFTGGTGSTILQVTSNTVFEYYVGGSGIQRAGAFNAQAPGNFSFAPSRDSRAYGEDSIALGRGTKASGSSQTVVGQYNNPNLTDAFIVGNGTVSIPSNAFNVTNSGDTYANNRLFVTNVQIETTGASTGKVLKYDGTKFTPQFETITGSTNTTGGTGVLASISNNNIVGRALTGTNRVSITEVANLITINSPIEVETGDIGTLAIYRSSSPIVYSSYTASSITGITIKLGTHITPITSRTYTIPDVKNDANFVMTEGNQTINGKKEFISGITIGNDPQTSSDQFDEQINHNIYNLFQPNDNKLESFEKISGISYISEKIYADNGTKLLADSISGLSILKNSYYQFNLTSNVSGTVVGNLENINVNSNGRDTNIVGKYNIYDFYSSPSSNYNSNLIGNYFESRLKTELVAQTIESFKTIQLGYFSSVKANSPIKRAYDIYIAKLLVSETEPLNAPLIGSFASIYIEGKTTLPNSDIFKRIIKQSGNTSFTNAPWSLFAEADRAYIGSTLVLASGITLSSTTRGAWLDIGASQATRPHINLSAGTNPSSPQIGDLWWNGTELYFRKDGSTNVNLLSGGTGSTTIGSGSTSGKSLGDGVKVLFSSDTSNLAFVTLSSITPSTLSIVSSSTGVILFSVTGGTGSTLTGNFLPLSGGTLTGGLSATTISASTFIGDASNLTGVLSKTLLTANIPVTSQVAQVNTFYLYDKLTITSSTPNVTVTSITSDVSINAYTPSIKFFANTGVTVTFQNSATLKTEGGLDAVIVGDNYDSVTFTYNNNIQKYFQTNINNYI
jgi:hypothetical protein